MENKPLVPFARDFALKVHAKNITTTRNGLKRPQTIHLQEVADLVWASGGTDIEIAAAWLHDSIEDTPTTLEDIIKHFGPEVGALVDGLTDLEHFKNMPLQERKQKQAERILTKSESVKRIKIADQTSNVRGLALDPTITMAALECKQYIEGAKAIVDNCKGVSPVLEALFEKAYELGHERYRTA